MKSVRPYQSGFAVLPVLAVIAIIALVGGIGYVAWTNFGKQAVTDQQLNAASQAAKAECEKENDKDICRFVTNWKLNETYRITSTTPEGKFVYEIDGDKTRMKSEGQMAYEVISIDKSTYTKGGNVWYKQTVKNPEEDIAAGAKVEFDEPADSVESEDKSKSKTTYKLIAKEACGGLQCFKYEVVDPENTDTKEFIWFDDKDYKLRKTVSESAEGKSESTFDYENVTVSVPSPVKELAADEYLMPGATTPTKMPSGFGE